MKELINDIFGIIKDYREDEDDPTVAMSKVRIETWINQFEEKDRSFILTEMKNIFKKRYISKQKVTYQC